MKRACYDIETMADFFSVTFLDYDSDEVIQFEISRRKNQLKEIKEFLSSVKYLIGFNSIYFDNIVLQCMIENNIDDVSEIYALSQLVINQEHRYEEFKPYKKYSYWKSIQSIDLFAYWSRMLRLSKKMSLKYFAVNLDEEVLEMPIHHTATNLSDEQMDLILQYNINDCFVTKKLAEKLREEINLRISIRKDYKLECLSWDAPKIASEILLDSYCKIAKKDKYEMRKNKYYKPSNFRIGDFVPPIEFKTELFNSLKQRILNSYNEFSEEFMFKNVDGSYLKLQYSSGGLHSDNKNQKYISSEEELIVEVDFSSLYPNLYILYNFNSPSFGMDLVEIQRKVLAERIAAKRAKRKVEDTTKKLILNSYSGLLDNQYSPFYAPEYALGMRITGQLCISRVIEWFYLKRIKIISSNTDSVTVVLPKKQHHFIEEVKAQIKKELYFDLEETIYKFIYYSSVNDYIALTDDGKVKQKGAFISDKQIDGSNEFLIIPIALKEYFVNHTPVEKTIKQHENIYDFVSAKKIAKNYKVFYRGNQVQQLNRFFVSDRKNGAYLYKQKEGKTTMENVLKETPVYILNEKTNKKAQEFPIDFTWYINKAQEVINTFEPKQMSLF